MPAKHLAASVAIALFAAAALAHADTFVVDSRAGLANVADSASPSSCPRGEVTGGVALNEQESADQNPATVATHSKSAAHPRQVGADAGHDESSGGISAASNDTSMSEGAPAKASTVRKASGVLHWQSLLPGVMK